MEYILLIFALVIILWIILLIKFRKKRKTLPSARIKFFEKRLKVILWPAYSYREQILDLDKLLHYLLKDLGYEWTLGEILKLQPEEILDINEIWRLHKLRNKLAHDFDEVAETTLRRDSKKFESQIRSILKKVT